MPLWNTKRPQKKPQKSTPATSKQSSTYQATPSDKGGAKYVDKTTTKASYKKYECHVGNRQIIQLESEGSGWLLAGGWSRSAVIRGNQAVIDLTGTRTLTSQDIEPANDAGRRAFSNILETTSAGVPILHLYIKDFDVPNDMKSYHWEALADDVKAIMSEGKDVLVACQGGHGRTGMVVAILARILRPDITGVDPITWLRDHYCKEVVETVSQINYVYDMLDLPRPPGVTARSYYGSGAYGTSTGKWKGEQAWWEKKDTIGATYLDHETGAWVDIPNTTPSDDDEDEIVWDKWFSEFMAEKSAYR